MDLHTILIPLDPVHLEGPFATGQADLFKLIDGRGIASIEELEQEVNWLDQFDYVYCQLMKDQVTLKAIRIAVEEDFKNYRVPVWIQSEEEMICCGRQMEFVGQINDSNICCEAPSYAKLWWHDTASFYVFTCSQCLEVKALGQQY